MEGYDLLYPKVMIGIFHFLSDASKVVYWLLQVLKFERTDNNLLPLHFVRHSTLFTEICTVTATLNLYL